MEIKAKEKADKNKNLLAGINLGRICMKNYILSRPDTDFLQHSIQVEPM
jgi:hypothetical protein